MYGIIYKITNKINNKLYIGQTIRDINQRLTRHIHDANKNPKTQINIQRAILKYGAQSFKIQQIDTAQDQDDLNKKQIYWIQFYQAYSKGYNMTPGGDGGNTYKCRTQSQMKITRQKLSRSKLGQLNGMSKQIKCKNIKTNEQYTFGSIARCLAFLGFKNKKFIQDRIEQKVNTYWRDQWMFAYKDKPYAQYRFKTADQKCKKGFKVTLQYKGQRLVYPSVTRALQVIGLPSMRLVPGMVLNDYLVVSVESVSTIRDECNGVGSEISTDSKRVAM